MEPKGVQSVPAKSANNPFAVMMYKLKEDHLVEYTEVQMIHGFSFEDMISSIMFNDKPSA